MHRELATERLDRLARCLRLERDQDADFAEAGCQRIVDVGGDMPLADRKPRRPAQYEVLANATDELGQLLGDRAASAGIGHLLERLNVAIAGTHERRAGANDRL